MNITNEMCDVMVVKMWIFLIILEIFDEASDQFKNGKGDF